MREDEAYLEIAERFIDSCNGHLNNAINIQEVIGFITYHAFESLGGAFNSHYGHTVPTGHVQKINAFIANSRHVPQVNRHSIAVVAMLVASMRNKYLYPEFVSGTYKNPKDQLSMTDARTIVSRVKGILRQIRKIV
jgi:hypothetical protein